MGDGGVESNKQSIGIERFLEVPLTTHVDLLL